MTAVVADANVSNSPCAIRKIDGTLGTQYAVLKNKWNVLFEAHI